MIRLRRYLALAILLSCHDPLITYSEDRGRLVFEDSFDRDESQKTKDEVGNGWTTNGDKPWSRGPKQTELRDGALYVTPADGKESGVLVIRPTNLQDGTIAFRFLLLHDNDEIGLVIADNALKNVHAGHVMSVRVSRDNVKLTDMLTGAFDPELFKKRKSRLLSNEEKQLISSKTKTYPTAISLSEWHQLSISIKGDRLSTSIDDKEVGSFSSAGFANHKTILRISVKRFGAIDDFEIYDAKAKPTQ